LDFRPHDGYVELINFKRSSLVGKGSENGKNTKCGNRGPLTISLKKPTYKTREKIPP
jgi:hypothetical protein